MGRQGRAFRGSAIAPVLFSKAPSPSNPLRATAPWQCPTLCRCSATLEAASWSWLRFGGFHFASLHEDRLCYARPKPWPLPWLHTLFNPSHRTSLSWRHLLLRLAPRRFSHRTRPPFGRQYPHPSHLRSQCRQPHPAQTPAGGHPDVEITLRKTVDSTLPNNVDVKRLQPHHPDSEFLLFLADCHGVVEITLFFLGDDFVLNQTRLPV